MPRDLADGARYRYGSETIVNQGGASSVRSQHSLPWRLASGIVGFAGILIWGVACSDSGGNRSSEQLGHEPARTGNQFSGDQRRELQAFEAEQASRDQRTWAPEYAARRYEGVVFDLWDRLNQSATPLQELSSFVFDTLHFATLSPGKQLDHGISRSEFIGPKVSLAFSEWETRLREWLADGWELVFESCRQVGFDAEAKDGPWSEFELAIHGLNRSTNQRVILRGRLDIVWKTDEESGENAPMPSKVSLRDAEYLTRSGEPIFQLVVDREIMPHTSTRFIDPVIVADFDGNTRADILFSGCNVMYSGIAGGGLRSGTLVQGSKPVVYTSLYADLTGDGIRDYVVSDRRGISTFPGGQEFSQFLRSWEPDEPMSNPSVMSAGDIDGDGDQDVWLAQYKMPYVAGQMPTPFFDANDGFAWYLLRNDGTGRLEDITAESGLAAKQLRRTYSGSLIDLDGDHDLDLVTVSDFAGIDWFRNDGRGHFDDVSDETVGSNIGFGMAHAFADLDQSGTLDVLMIGMHSTVADRLDGLGLWPEGVSWDPIQRTAMAVGNRVYFGDGGRYAERPFGRDIARAGWAWGVGALDFDNDGDEDVFIANGHKSRKSVRDYDEQFWTHDIFVASSAHDPMLDLHFRKVGTELYGAGYSYGGYQCNKFYLNIDGKQFVEVGHLVGLADERDGRNVVCADFDQDGLLDVVATFSEVWPVGKQSFRLYQNLLEGGEHWIGFRLPEGIRQHGRLGATLAIRHGSREQTRVLTSGDSYRSQMAGPIHFGLGGATESVDVVLTFPGGETQEFKGLAPGRYHDLEPAPSNTEE